MQVDHQPTKILVVGKSGSGKTTYLIRYIENAQADHFFIFDHKLEFQHRLNIPACFDFDQCLERMEQGERFILWNHTAEFPGDSEAGFACFCEWAFEIAKALQKHCYFVGDEVNRFTSGHDMGWEFGQSIEDGRLQGLDFIGTAHATNQIHNRLGGQLSELVAFKTIHPRPLAFLENEGFDVEKVKALPIGAFICKSMDDESFTEGKLFSRQREPENAKPEKDEAVPSEPVQQDTTDDKPVNPDGSDTIKEETL